MNKILKKKKNIKTATFSYQPPKQFVLEEWMIIKHGLAALDAIQIVRYGRIR